jgi:hypothetical protein
MGKTRDPFYDYVRALAALLVLFGHKGKIPGGAIAETIPQEIMMRAIQTRAPTAPERGWKATERQWNLSMSNRPRYDALRLNADITTEGLLCWQPEGVATACFG